MPLEVSYVEENELEDFVQIQLAAFDSGMASKLSPKPVTPERVAKSVNDLRNTRDEPEVHLLKVLDTDTGKIISCAKWRFNLKERSKEEVEESLPKVPEPLPDSNVAAEKDFVEYLANSRREWMGGKPFYFMHVLATHPDHHRRGAGAMLLKWGLDQADKAGLPSYLEASDMGRPLYERLGYRPVKETFFDLSKYGAEGMERNTAMLRDPRPVPDS
ncbi:acyl-CoA N-acyltransferase [Lepidopterella palustris CBS 459.81]|uniref:Acyl-CoA N-acyltransferase n=1 Tax=Lepidopterella palustris CBS 459.81 TaxID=1314670 RepID=A0A8E2JFR5_9PEZI|nr:acyl-CoA N-acyltransferase [Lepidopterella palustris CBS 459.81]